MTPNLATFIRGVKDSADSISQEKPIEIHEKIWMWDPLKNTGLGWILRNGGKAPTTEKEFGHLEDSPFANWVTYTGNDSDGSGVGESSQQVTAIHFASGEGPRVAAGSRIVWTRTEERSRGITGAELQPTS